MSQCALERTTVWLINAIANASYGRGNSQRMAQLMGQHLPASDLRMLQVLTGTKRLTTSELASQLRIDLAQTSRQVTRLVDLGYLERKRDARDRRRTLVTLTPAMSAVMDQWLMEWTGDYIDAASGMSSSEIEELAAWFDRVQSGLEPTLQIVDLSISERWEHLSANLEITETERRLAVTMVRFATWVGMSGGYKELLERVGSPVRQHAYFALKAVQRHGQLSVASLAEQLGTDRSQASKRVRQLAEAKLIDRAVDGFDRRSTLIRLSKRGADLLRSVHREQLGTFVDTLATTELSNREHLGQLVSAYVGRLADSRSNAR